MTSTPLTAPTVSIDPESLSILTQATTTAASVFCYNHQDPGVTTGCECDGLTVVFPQMPSTKGQTGYDACGWTTTPPSASSTTASTGYVTANDGVISYCTDAVRADADVNDALSCVVTATPVSTDSAIASAYSVSWSSKATAEAAAEPTASAASKVSGGDIVIALQDVVTSGTKPEYDYWAVRNFEGEDGGLCSGSSDLYNDSDLKNELKRGDSGSLITDSIPYPPSFNFTSDLTRGQADLGSSVSSLGEWPCYYDGSSDGPGTISCTGWKNVTCSNDLKNANKKVDCGEGSSEWAEDLAYYPKVLCSFKESDKNTMIH